MQGTAKTGRRGLVVFVHIPKTAGTTIHSIIAHQYAPDEVFSIHRNGSFKQTTRFKAILKQEQDTLRLIQGHIDFSWGKFFPQDARFFTTLRDPVERAISHYHQYRRATTDPIHELSMQSTLQQWVRDRGLAEMDNGMTRRLAGEMELPIGKLTPQILDRAKANLVYKFAVVGITERFEESQILLHRAFNWPYCRYPALNVGETRLRRSELSAEELSVIESCNRFDLELYRFGLELFEHAVSKVDMAGELALLKAAPECLQPLQSIRRPRATSLYRRTISGLKSLLSAQKLPKLSLYLSSAWLANSILANWASVFVQL